jgi:hypothetical protein
MPWWAAILVGLFVIGGIVVVIVWLMGRGGAGGGESG